MSKNDENAIIGVKFTGNFEHPMSNSFGRSSSESLTKKSGLLPAYTEKNKIKYGYNDFDANKVHESKIMGEYEAET